MSKAAITISGLGKMYRIAGPRAKYYTLRDAVSNVLMAPFKKGGQLLRGRVGDLDEMIWALKDISCEVKQGEALGVIGHNGAGKSTMLKILSRITDPTEGSVEIRGRVSALLEVGAAFHQELTGRENIYLSGVIRGMKKSEIDRKFGEIVEFSGVEKFLDTPVKRYSSGMIVRLGFSIAAHMEPDVLIIDEVLAVGDADFRRKSMAKILKVAREGRTVIFVSHNVQSVATLCQQVLWLDGGRAHRLGPADDVIAEYLTNCSDDVGEWLPEESAVEDEETIPLVVNAVRLRDAAGEISSRLERKKPFTIELDYTVKELLERCLIELTVSTMQGDTVFTAYDSDAEGIVRPVRLPGQYLCRCRVPANILNTKSFSVSVRIKGNGEQLLTLDNVISFDMNDFSAEGKMEVKKRQGVIRPEIDWETHYRPEGPDAA
ncbi:MAG: ABC transporter ATP-binding protein [Candidatus Margulisiibacteriota bacterium]